MTTKIRFPFPNAPEPGIGIEIARDILWFLLPLPGALDHVNVYALRDADGWTLIDTGMNTKKTRAVWDTLLLGPLQGAPVRRVILTHHHPDHVGLVGWFQAMGAELLTTRTAWLYARMLTLDDHDRPKPESEVFQRRAGMPETMIAARRTQRPFNFCDVVAPMPLGFQSLAEDARLELAGRIWRVRIGHGHAPDHITLWDESGQIVIGGDQLLPGISANIGVYPTEPDANPLKLWLESCAKFQAIATDEQLVLPGHKLPYFGLPFRLTQMIDNHQVVLNQLDQFLTHPRTAVGCFKTMFRRDIGDEEYGLALAEAVAHLNYLHQSGQVTRTRTDGAADLWQKA